MMTVDRRAFLRLSLGSVCVGVAADCSKPIANPAFVLEETSIDLVQQAMTDGIPTARSLCEQYLQRVAMLNPTLHALIETNPDALSVADDPIASGASAVLAVHCTGSLSSSKTTSKRQIGCRRRLARSPRKAWRRPEDAVRHRAPASRRRDPARESQSDVSGREEVDVTATALEEDRHSTSYDPQRTPLGSSSGSGVTASAILGGGWSRHRNHGLDSRTERAARCGGCEADGWPREPDRSGTRGPLNGHGRTRWRATWQMRPIC